MTELFYWKETERRARAAQALAMLSNRMDSDGIYRANAFLDELCLDRTGAERLIRSRMPQRPSRTVSPSPPATRSIGGLESCHRALQTAIGRRPNSVVHAWFVGGRHSRAPGSGRFRGEAELRLVYEARID